MTLPVTGGHVKLQWKPDFGARWAALDVDFEMYGKEHATNTPIYDRICEILGGRPPEHFVYELFLDEQGQKISKSQGQRPVDGGVAAPMRARSRSRYFMYGKPKTAKRLYFDVIPKAMDDYHQQLRAWPGQDPAARLANPVWHIHGGQPPASDMVVPYSMLLNLASAANADGQGGALGLHPQVRARGEPGDASGARRGGGLRGALLRGLREAGQDLPRARPARGGGARRPARPARAPGTGRRRPRRCRRWSSRSGASTGSSRCAPGSRAIYEVLLGAEQGPRFGGFIALYGVAETAALIEAALDGRLAEAGQVSA